MCTQPGYELKADFSYLNPLLQLLNSYSLILSKGAILTWAGMTKAEGLHHIHCKLEQSGASLGKGHICSHQQFNRLSSEQAVLPKSGPCSQGPGAWRGLMAHPETASSPPSPYPRAPHTLGLTLLLALANQQQAWREGAGWCFRTSTVAVGLTQAANVGTLEVEHLVWIGSSLC